MKNWPFLVGGLIVLVVIVALGVFFFLPKEKSTKPQQGEGEITEVVPPEIEARPFFSFVPRGDGRAIQISISGISQGQKIDYEITYKTGAGLDQGIGGPVALEAGQTFYTREHIFGTCSKNVCTYDKGVENGKWLATVQKGFEAYELSGEWRLQNPGTKSAKLGFEDKFELAIDPGTFSRSFFVISSENSSLPKKLPDGARSVAGPFTIAASEQVSVKKPPKVTFFGRGTNLQILQISAANPDWTFLETKFDSATQTATATTSAFGTFVLVEKI